MIESYFIKLLHLQITLRSLKIGRRRCEDPTYADKHVIRRFPRYFQIFKCPS